MLWKVGIGLFFLMALIAGGDIAQVFIGVPVGLMLLVGAGIAHEKIFKRDPMKSATLFETLTLLVFVLVALLLSFWLVKNVIR
jgi:hypothetical protein